MNEIETIETKNCKIHICGNAIVESAEQEKIWISFSESAYKLCTNIK